jgi:hypothetical protein
VGSSYYDGEWSYGRKKGKGEMSAYGEFYSGEWNSTKMGSGRYMWENGDAF